jgi:hypothetical protein
MLQLKSVEMAPTSFVPSFQDICDSELLSSEFTYYVFAIRARLFLNGTAPKYTYLTYEGIGSIARFIYCQLQAHP